MSRARVNYFFSFRSPYSYLSGPRVFALPDEYDIELVWRGVPPMVKRGVPLSKAKKFYLLLDAARVARRLDMPFGRIVDPLGPGAVRCLKITEYAKECGKTAQFVLAASRAIWSEGAEVASDGPLFRACEQVGLDISGCRAALSNAVYEKRLEENIALLGRIGHWGVPTMEIDGEVYWGQDRIDFLKAHLDELGLRK